MSGVLRPTGVRCAKVTLSGQVIAVRVKHHDQLRSLTFQHKKGVAMSKATYAFRVDAALKTAFSAAAKVHDQTGAQLLRGFMRDYVMRQQKATEYDAWLQAKIERSQASANTGNLVPAVEVDAKFAARRTALRRRIDTTK